MFLALCKNDHFGVYLYPPAKRVETDQRVTETVVFGRRTPKSSTIKAAAVLPIVTEWMRMVGKLCLCESHLNDAETPSAIVCWHLDVFRLVRP